MIAALIGEPTASAHAASSTAASSTAASVASVSGAAQSIVQDLEGSAARFVNRELAQTTALYFACFGFYLLMAFFFFVHWRWMRRDLPMLSVGLMSLVMAAHTAAISGSLPFVIPSIVDAEVGMAIEAASYILLNGFVAFMLWAFFPTSFRPRATDWIGLVNTLVAGGAAVASSFLAAWTVAFGTENTLALPISRWITVVLMIVVAALAIQSLESKRVYGTITAVGLGLLVVGSMHDVLFADVGGAGRPYLITFSVLAFALLQSYVVLRRSAESTQLARLSSRRLRREVEARTKELRAASVAAQAANMAKTEFVTAVTHELRTPLASLLGYVDLIREEASAEFSEEQIEFFSSLELSAERLLNLVNNLLDLAKIESGHIDITISEVDVARVVEEVRDQMYPIAHEKGLAVDTVLETDETVVQTDEQWFSVVLANLVSNAVKYTETGSVTIRVRHGSLGSCPAISIDVTDTGPGISSAFMPRLFHRFTREERARDDAPSGTGLGLTITRELLEHLGGEISVESRESMGSTFTIVLPVAGPAVDA